MIETQTLAAPISVIRAIADPPRPAPLQEARDRAANPPDPDAPAGPRPTFRFTPLEQIRELHTVESMHGARDARAVTAYVRDATTRGVTDLALDRMV